MTLNAGTTRIRYTASGGTDFTFDFPIWLKTDIKVYVDEGEKTVDTDYTVTFTAGSESGGTVGFLSAPNSGLNVEIVRRLDVERDSDFATSGAFSMATLNEQLDKLTAFVQDSRDRIDRTVEIPAATSGGVSPALGAPAALSMIRWNSGATAWEYITTDDIDTTVQASAWVIDTFTNGVDWTSGVTTDFTLTTTPGPEKNTQIYLDGVYQAKGLYVLVGDTVTFAAAPTGTTLESMVITAAESQSISTAESIQFNTAAGITVGEGELSWNDTAKTLDLGLPGDVTMQIGQEIPLYVKNTSGDVVGDGEMVYVAGSTGVHLIVGLADASDVTKSSQVGMVTTAAGIANNGFGFVTRFGAVRGLDADGSVASETWNDGDLLYLSAATPGGLTKTPPGTPNFTVEVGVVINNNGAQGVIGVDPKQPHAADVALGTSDLVGPTQGAVKANVDSIKTMLDSDTANATVASGGGAYETLMSFTIPAGTFGANDGFAVKVRGTFSGTAGNKRLTIDVTDESAHTITGPVISTTTSAGAISAELEVLERTDSASVKYSYLGVLALAMVDHSVGAGSSLVISEELTVVVKGSKVEAADAVTVHSSVVEQLLRAS